MPNYEKLLQAVRSETLEEAVEAISGVYQAAEDLLSADVTLLEELPLVAFAYFNREDVFYVNKAGRRLLSLKQPYSEVRSPPSPPIFWLEDNKGFIAADRVVYERGQTLMNTRELLTLSWGKTWLEGYKFPIVSTLGKPLAILFAGSETSPSEQIRHVADQYQLTQTGIGDN